MIITLSLLAYIILRQPAADKPTGRKYPSSYSTSIFQPIAQPKAMVKPVSFVKSNVNTNELNKNTKNSISPPLQRQANEGFQ